MVTTANILPLTTKACALCGEQFDPGPKKGTAKKFCSDVCRKEASCKYFQERYETKTYGHLLTDAERHEIEEARRQKISKTKKGKAQSLEHRAAMSASRKKLFAEGKLTPAVYERTPEMREKNRQATLKAWEEGRLSNKDGLAVGANRTAEERAAAWTVEKRAAQANRTLKAYQEGRMEIHGRSRGIWSLYDGPNGQIKMRSRSETLFAYHLDSLDITWQYEPQRFDLGWTTYTPDFHLPESDHWVEVKGGWTEVSRRKFDEFSMTHAASVVLAKDILRGNFSIGVAGLPSLFIGG